MMMSESIFGVMMIMLVLCCRGHELFLVQLVGLLDSSFTGYVYLLMA